MDLFSNYPIADYAGLEFGSPPTSPADWRGNNVIEEEEEDELEEEMEHKGKLIMEGVISGKILKARMSLLKDFADEITLIVDKEGLKVDEMDPSQISLIKINVPVADMHVYQNSEPQKITIGTETLAAGLSYVKDEEDVCFMLYKEDGGEYEFCFIGDFGEMACHGVASSKYATKTPHLPKGTRLRIEDGLLFKEALKRLKDVSRHTEIITKTCLIGELAAADEGIKLAIPFSAVKIMGIEKEGEADVVASYNTLQILNILTDDLLKAGGDIIVDYATNAPLHISFNGVDYWLAPRIEGSGG